MPHIDQGGGRIHAVLGALGGRELARVSKAHNAVAFSIPAASLSALAAQPGVLTVRPVIDYQLDGNPTPETVPYIADEQQLGVTGKDIRVAVLDSGIDYTHQDLGGSGDVADYIAAYGTETGLTKNPQPNTQLPSKPGLFPSVKVVGGYDFVGEQWPNGDLAPDPNPIPCGLGTPITGSTTNPPATCDSTHGTHVADIIAGASTDGTHKGVAPGALLYAVKVCSSVSTACSGIALIQGMEFALDPDGDGDVDDAVDVINMSLGSNYGQFEDDLTAASENASRLGVVVVCAAGNAADHPYIVSSPSIAPGAISVAQTQVPSARNYWLVINTAASIAGTYKATATVDWGPVQETTPDGFAASVRVDRAPWQPLVKSMVAGSARGPSYSYQTIKPEIGARGASVSASAGTGTAEAAFGGTSGATPMIAGSAALLLEALPKASPAEIKARLMNNSETQIETAPNLFGTQLAPATRIRGGAARGDRPLKATSGAWVPED